MKKLIAISALMALVCSSLNAQDTTAADSKALITVGLSAGATLYSSANDFSPYYSKHGFFLQIPVLCEYSFTPHWKFSIGLRYDFNWDPLANGVEEIWSENGEVNGLGHSTTPYIGKQNAYLFSGLLGVPVKITWYPRADRKKLLGIGLDYYIGYAVKQYYSISTEQITLINPATQAYNGSGDMASSGSPTLLPWRMEVGLTLSTDYLGLVHGVRLFFDLLPRYEDLLTGEKIRTTGITIFL